jgi:uncharacterized repeat protein (TIGR02543 family)
VTLTPPGGTYASGTVVQLQANPAAGWVFSGWSDDVSGSKNPETLTMDSDKTVTATFNTVPPRPTPTPNPIPEPTTLILVGVGLFGLLALLRRRRGQKK